MTSLGDGSKRPIDIANDVAAALTLSPEVVKLTQTDRNGGRYNLFQRRVRWILQTLKAKSFAINHDRLWSMTENGSERLSKAQLTQIVTIHVSPDGLLLWADARNAAAMIDDQSVDLILTSPPYPISKLGKQMGYGSECQETWLPWLTETLSAWLPKLTSTGSLMINVGPTWRSKQPRQTTFPERLLIALEDQLGMLLVQKLYWQNPSRKPGPFPWTVERKVRLNDKVEPILWVSKSADCKAHPDGLIRAPGEPKPNSLLSHADSTDRSRRTTQHPAVMPLALARDLITLGTDIDDVVADPFSGSGTTLLAAQQLGRRWIGADHSLGYVLTASPV